MISTGLALTASVQSSMGQDTSRFKTAGQPVLEMNDAQRQWPFCFPHSYPWQLPN